MSVQETVIRRCLKMKVLVVVFAIFSAARAAEICCEPSGECFSDDPPFDGPSWPLPECITPTFRLYRNDIIGWSEISRGDTPPQYNRNQDTIFVVHGWQNDGDTAWVQDAKDAFLRTGDFNVVVMDWGVGAGNAYYPQSASNVRVNGAELADISAQLNPTYSWCVGHSLGAHSCGHGGKAGANWDRISGLDPAGPNFDLEGCAAQPAQCRLHPSDAPQVDASHTNGIGVDSYGTLTPHGDIDFYPNGAELQPSCPDTAVDLGCSHGMATEYFIISIEDDCFVVREECSNENNLPGSCSGCGVGGCPNMGASTSFGNGLYYLETDADFPYCQG